MKIHAVKVSNYRIHRNLDVRFDDQLTLLAGPNESGKSTLVEAMHMGLYLRPSAAGETRKSMLDTIGPGGVPEVEVEFSAKGGRHVVRKVFTGTTNASISLQTDGGRPLTGAQAEARLADLLGIQSLATAKEIDGLVENNGHLWVRQGSAMNAPGQFVPRGDELLRLLQVAGAAGVIMSDNDRRALERLKETVESTYNKNRSQPLAASEFGQARKELEDTEKRREQAETKLAELNSASADLRQAEKKLEESEVELARITDLITENEVRLSQIQLRVMELNEISLKATQAQTKLNGMLKDESDLKSKQSRLEAVRSELQPLANKVTSLQATLVAAQAAVATLGQLRDAAVLRTRQARTENDTCLAMQAMLEKGARLRQLRQLQSNIANFESEITKTEHAIAALPAITSRKLSALKEISGAIRDLEIKLEAAAVSISVEIGKTVEVNGTTLPVGESRILTRPGFITVGEDTKILVVPGGNDAIVLIEEGLNKKREELNGELRALAIGSVVEAEAAANRLTDLKAQLKQQKSGLELLRETEPDLDQELKKIVAEMENQKRVWQLAGEPELPANEVEAAGRLMTAKAQVETAEREQDDLESQVNAAHLQETETRNLLDSANRERETKGAEVGGLEAVIRAAIERLGDDETRAAALNAAKDNQVATAASLEAKKKELELLAPENAELDKKRLAASKATTTTAIELARKTINTNRGVLKANGVENPEETAALARGAHEKAVQREKEAREKAEALLLLETLAREAQASINQEQGRPLKEKVDRYLAHVFGPQASTALEWGEDNGLDGILLNRNTHGRGTVPMESLSGGAKEQAGIAVRLAIAELIQERDGEPQMVILDDSFAYSDQARIRGIQPMLYDAATRNLQVIVLTCNPTDFAALGAARVDMPAPAVR